MAVHSLSRDELLKLLEAARRNRPRDWLMFLVTYWHGFRVSETIALKPESVRDGYITVQRLKGSLKTVQPLVSSSEPLLNEADALPAYLRRFGSGERLFPITRQYFWRLFEQYAAEVGIAAHKRHPHVLKHSIAMQSIKTAGIENVRQHLGHRSMSSTGEYLRVSDDQASSAVVNGIAGEPRVAAAKPTAADRYSSAAKKAWATRRAKGKC